MTPTTLVAGGHAGQREAAIAATLDPTRRTVLLLEGLASGGTALAAGPLLEIQRIAAGCPCCSGQLALRVTLNRILRRPPQALYIGLADAAHLAPLRQLLCAPPYDALLRLNQDLRPGSN